MRCEELRVPGFELLELAPCTANQIGLGRDNRVFSKLVGAEEAFEQRAPYW